MQLRSAYILVLLGELRLQY